MPCASELFNPDHDGTGFDCGASSRHTWLERRAAANQLSGASRTFVICEGEEAKAFYLPLGLEESPFDPMTLMVTVADLQAATQP